MELLELIDNKKKEYEQHRALLDNLESYNEDAILSLFECMENAILYVRYRLYPEFIDACEKDLLCILPYEKNSKGISILNENSSEEVKKAYRALVLSLCEVLIYRDYKPDDIIMARDDSSKVSAMYVKCLAKVPKWLQNK